MKNLIRTVYILFIVMIFTSCSNDDNLETSYLDSASNSVSIEGKWIYSDLNVSNKGYTPKCNPNFIEFNPNGDFIKGDYNNQKTGCVLELKYGTWFKERNVINISFDRDLIVYELLSVTNSELKVKYTYSDNEYEYVENITFVRDSGNEVVSPTKLNTPISKP